MSTEVSEVHKFDRESGLTWREDFVLHFEDYIIPFVQALCETDRIECLETLENAAYRMAEGQGRKAGQGLPSNDFAAFKEVVHGAFASPAYLNCLVSEFVEDTARALEVRVVECLWAQTFRQANALQTGYAMICHGDFGFPVGFNPKIRLVRTKCLMQGDDCCNHRWVLED